jgi:hypothetical protein
MKEFYEAPDVQVIEMELEGMISASGGREDYGDRTDI